MILVRRVYILLSTSISLSEHYPINGGNVEVRLDGAAPNSQLISSSLAAGGQVQVNGSDFSTNSDRSIDSGDTITIVTTGSDRQNVIARFEIPQ